MYSLFHNLTTNNTNVIQRQQKQTGKKCSLLHSLTAKSEKASKILKQARRGIKHVIYSEILTAQTVVTENSTCSLLHNLAGKNVIKKIPKLAWWSVWNMYLFWNPGSKKCNDTFVKRVSKIPQENSTCSLLHNMAAKNEKAYKIPNLARRWSVSQICIYSEILAAKSAMTHMWKMAK